jgi:outer membrane protein OmpA-like peptidoglycan-associated protein
VNSERRVEFFGDFVEEITNITIDGVNLSFNSWVKTNLTLKFTLPGATEKKLSIQIFNGSVPLLKSQELLCQEVPPTSVITSTPTPTPTLAPTPKPTVNMQPNITMKKIAAIGFDLNSYFLSTAARLQITKLAEQLNASSAQTVLIYGNTDAQGGVDNVWLSKQRAKAVRVYMSPMLKEKKIRLGWFAATRPAVKGNSKAAYAANRRVEIWVK